MDARSVNHTCPADNGKTELCIQGVVTSRDPYGGRPDYRKCGCICHDERKISGVPWELGTTSNSVTIRAD